MGGSETGEKKITLTTFEVQQVLKYLFLVLYIIFKISL